MYDNLIRFFQKYIPVSKELNEEICSLFKETKFKNDQFLLKSGQVARFLYFLNSGSVRTYYEHGTKEVTTWFYLEQYLFTSWSSFITQKPSIEYIELLSESVILEISYENWQLLFRKYPEFNKFGRLISEEQIVGIEDVSKGFMFMTAKQKYELLLQYFPGITQKVSLGHIASFLGISQETLSRIRR